MCFRLVAIHAVRMVFFFFSWKALLLIWHGTNMFYTICEIFHGLNGFLGTELALIHFHLHGNVERLVWICFEWELLELVCDNTMCICAEWIEPFVHRIQWRSKILSTKIKRFDFFFSTICLRLSLWTSPNWFVFKIHLTKCKFFFSWTN